jgi:hypothetical protein
VTMRLAKRHGRRRPVTTSAYLVPERLRLARHRWNRAIRNRRTATFALLHLCRGPLPHMARHEPAAAAAQVKSRLGPTTLPPRREISSATRPRLRSRPARPHNATT